LIRVPRDQVDAALAVLGTEVGPTLIGAYLYGSGVTGGLRPDSDIDLFGLVARGLRPAERRRIVEGLLPLSGRQTRPATWRPIELTLVVHGEVRPWRYPPRSELQYGEWLRPAFLAGDPTQGPSENSDLALLVTMLIHDSEALIGPPARELLDPVPRPDVLRAMRDGVPALLGDLDTDTRNVLLTLARMWMTASTGEVQPKDAAADWALDRLPEEHRPLLARARAGYLGEADDRWEDQAAVNALARHLSARIEEETRPLPPPDASV
jgi:predicted nucleotidyltransferase